MTKQTANHGKRWSEEDVIKFQDLADQNTPTRVIALKLRRTENAVRSKASEEHI